MYMNKNNLKDFQNGIFNNYNPFKRDTLNGLLKELPTIPSIYFDNDIITKYYAIKAYLQELGIIQEKILFILDTSKEDLSKIKVSQSTYKITKENLIIPIDSGDYKQNFKTQDDFKKFVATYIENDNFNIFKDNGVSQKSLSFYYIFQNVYHEESKDFFLSLFKQYINIRKELLTMIKDNYSIMAFKSFFELPSEKVSHTNANKNTNKTDPNKINYSHFEMTSNSVNNKNASKNASKNTNNSDTSLLSKINKYDSLYVVNYNDNETSKSFHKENIKKLFSTFYDSLTHLVGNEAKNNLYNICYYDLKTDLDLLNFIFYYFDPKLFDKCIDVNFKIKSKIFKSINVFNMYYYLYIQWWKKLKLTHSVSLKNSDSSSSNDNNIEDFNTFLNSSIKKMFLNND